jgi:hypothetical protein
MSQLKIRIPQRFPDQGHEKPAPTLLREPWDGPQKRPQSAKVHPPRTNTGFV